MHRAFTLIFVTALLVTPAALFASGPKREEPRRTS